MCSVSGPTRFICASMLTAGFILLTADAAVVDFGFCTRYSKKYNDIEDSRTWRSGCQGRPGKKPLNECFSALFCNNNTNNNSMCLCMVLSSWLRAIVWVHPAVHLMNADWALGGTNPHTKPTKLGCGSADNWQLPSTPTIAIYCYHQCHLYRVAGNTVWWHPIVVTACLLTDIHSVHFTYLLLLLLLSPKADR